MADKYLPNIGENPRPSAMRDAVHIAVIPFVAGEDLYAGNYVKRSIVREDTVLICDDITDKQCIGVVDPFLLRGHVMKGEHIWVFILPNTISGLRHHWEHPLIQPLQDMGESEKYLKAFAEENNVRFGELIDGYRRAARGEDGFVTVHGTSRTPVVDDVLFHHLASYTGVSIGAAKDNLNWSCSC